MRFRTEIVLNFLFWLLYFLYQWLGLASLYGDYNGYFINACLALPVSFAFSWLTVHVYIDIFYKRNLRVLFLFAVFASSVCLIVIRRYFNHYIIYPRYFPEALSLPLLSPGKFLVQLVELYSTAALYCLYYFIQFWYREKERLQLLQQQKTYAELEMLKAQVQPHFIFNTLNNIYSTALRSSPETASLIAHLSEILSYSLYDASQDKVLLTQELTYIRHYLELQKNRYGARLDTLINIFNDVSRFEIAPLLLLPLIENSFKHGVADSTQASWVRVAVSEESGKVSILIENSRNTDGQNKNQNNSGLGLANVRKRLAILYPGKHELQVVESESSYLVILKIKND